MQFEFELNISGSWFGWASSKNHVNILLSMKNKKY